MDQKECGTLKSTPVYNGSNGQCIVKSTSCFSAISLLYSFKASIVTEKCVWICETNWHLVRKKCRQEDCPVNGFSFVAGDECLTVTRISSASLDNLTAVISDKSSGHINTTATHYPSGLITTLHLNCLPQWSVESSVSVQFTSLHVQLFCGDVNIWWTHKKHA